MKTTAVKTALGTRWDAAHHLAKKRVFSPKKQGSELLLKTHELLKTKTERPSKMNGVGKEARPE